MGGICSISDDQLDSLISFAFKTGQAPCCASMDADGCIVGDIGGGTLFYLALLIARTAAGGARAFSFRTPDLSFSQSAGGLQNNYFNLGWEMRALRRAGGICTSSGCTCGLSEGASPFAGRGDLIAHMRTQCKCPAPRVCC